MYRLYIVRNIGSKRVVGRGAGHSFSAIRKYEKWIKRGASIKDMRNLNEQLWIERLSVREVGR
jgi:hypothetical protein